MIQCHHGGRYQCRRHSGCCGSGVAASMGESATAMGRGRAVGPMRVSARRPRPVDGTVRQLAWGTRVVKLTTNSTVTSSTSGAVDREWPLRWANRRRQWAAGVPWARCRHRPVGLGRRDGPAAGLGYSSGEATISSTAGAVDREWPLRWANRRRRWAAGVPWARCRHRGPREGPAWGTHKHSSGETSGSTASGTQLRPQVTAKVSVAVSIC